jgi:hypothetical protein
MKTMTVTEVCKNFRAALDALEAEQEDIVLVCEQKPIARLVPEPAAKSALEVLGDLAGSLDEEAAESLSKCISEARSENAATLKELRKLIVLNVN